MHWPPKKSSHSSIQPTRHTHTLDSQLQQSLKRSSSSNRSSSKGAQLRHRIFLHLDRLVEMLAIFYFNAVIHIWDVKWARSLSNLTINILSLRRTQVHPLKPNLIELGRYRKIDRESVTWLRRVWTQGMAGFAKREGNQMNLKSKFKGAE